jgi:outer membrane receptor protein involved in Fe transport
MEKNRSVQQAVRYAIAAMAAASAPMAFAQTPPAAASANSDLTEVVVTGSRLKVANDASISPVTSITASDLQATGLTRVEDVLNNLPMVFAAQGSTVSNGSNGTATVNLRNLGARRTLVLVNGRRLGPGSFAGSNTSDINQIPGALIERIDVLTGGASSVYGADAVAGVVNFVLNTKFEGVKIDANYSFNNHSNNNGIASTVSARGFPLPSKTVNTGYGKDFSVIMGSNFQDGKGNAVFYATYRKDDAVLQDKYDYSSCTLNSPTSSAKIAAGSKATCGGSGTSATGYFAASGLGGTSLFTNTVDAKTGAFRPFNSATDLFNFGPLNYYQRPSERYTAGTFVNYDVTDHINAYSEFMFARNTSVAQIAPSGDFFLKSIIPCADPLLTASERTIICSPANIAAQTPVGGPVPTGIAMLIGRRNVEGGGRQATFGLTNYHAIIGARGDLGENWKFDVYGQYGTTAGSNGNLNYLSNARIQNALNVVTNPATGQPVCQSVLNKTDVACVPWNIWVPGGVTAAATNYLAIPLLIQGSVTERVVSGSFTGDLGGYGVKLPTANSGMQLNVGAEWRSEQSEFLPDLASQLGDAAGSGGKTVPVRGAFRVKELFTEMRMPLIENKPFAESLSIEGGYRYSEYSLGFNTDTYKLGLEWAPVQDIRFRGSYQRAVRAPNIGELFSPQAVGLDGVSDPCAGPKPLTPTAAQCAFSGVTAAQYGLIKANAAAQYNGLLGGNPTLKPEKADTYSIGFVFQPSFVPNLTVSADYFDIKIKNVVGAIGADTILQNCINTGNPVYCNAVHRSANGSLWQSPDGFISDTNVNFGSLTSKGIDLKGRYKHSVADFGSVSFNVEGTYAMESKIQNLDGGPQYDCVGFFGSNCGVPNPKWRHVASSTWATPWSGFDLTLRWRYMGKVASERTSSDPQLKKTFYPDTAFIGAYNYFDFSGSIDLKEFLTLRLGVNNVFDKDPPIAVSGTFSDCPTTLCNGNTYAQVYDTLGRYIYMHVSMKF